MIPLIFVLMLVRVASSTNVIDSIHVNVSFYASVNVSGPWKTIHGLRTDESAAGEILNQDHFLVLFLQH